jgi:hypothetical protein
MQGIFSNRRTFVIGSLALGATISLVGSAGSATVLPRKAVGAAEADPGELQLLRDAIALLRAKDSTRPAADGWEAIANPHVDHCFTGDSREIHFSWWFWPWHRAYLAAVEKRLQVVVGEPSLRLPYWNWFSVRDLPAALASPTYKATGGAIKPNPLHDATRASGPADRPPGLDTATITDAVLGGYASEDDLLRLPSFPVVGGRVAPPGGARTTTGIVEAGPHNNIHVWVGGRSGNMAQAFSPRDPTFLFHHCNIDRLWSAWIGLKTGGPHKNPPDETWLNHTFPLPHPSGIGMETYKISEILSTEDLGYTYETESPRISQPLIQMAQATAMTLKLNSSPLDLSGGEALTGLQSLETSNTRLRELLPSRATTLVLSEIKLPASTATISVYVRSDGLQTNEERNLVGVYTLLNPTGSSVVTDLRIPLPQRISDLLATLPNVGFAVVASSLNRERMSGFTVQDVSLTIE